ncbi:protein CROC-4 isoform X4 [Nomascus leucogenys]|uniref:protein CROC-4 isoform X4 n=1 Tax=Nomascus leucogenys TaxID=61853 RepID=UPI00122D87C7|nr:protein CROC-4 isoform X4 [Nomascus leucogenys]XP_030680061.1 protein CROC-4 isoform X4 [Nomascus leucogenys]
MSSEFLEDAVSHSSSKSGGQACMVDDGACLQAGICVHRLCLVKTLTCLWYTQIGPNNQARQDADNVWPQMSNWIAREMNFVGENIRTSKCWPSSPRKMRPPPALSLHLPTVTVSFTRRAARERKREASEIPEWIDRCYVIGAASSTPQEARSWGERGSPAAGATRTVSPPHRSLELGIQEEAASFVFWCHRRWPPMAFGLLTWGGWVLHHPPTLLPPCGRQSHIQHHGQLLGAFISSSSRQHKPLWNLHQVYRTVPLRPAAQDLSSP